MTPKFLTGISERSAIGSIRGADGNKGYSLGLAKLQLSRGTKGAVRSRGVRARHTDYGLEIAAMTAGALAMDEMTQQVYVK